MISVEQQFAEKLHAYTLPRELQQNSRVKDLVDMLLLKQLRSIDRAHFGYTLQKVYAIRGTHPLPQKLAPPPSDWLPLFERLAAECGLAQSMQEGYDELRGFFQTQLTL